MTKVSINTGIRLCRKAVERARRGGQRIAGDIIPIALPPAHRAFPSRRLCAAFLSFAVVPMALMTLRGPTRASAATKPNIVLFLTDDLDTSLIN